MILADTPPGRSRILPAAVALAYAVACLAVYGNTLGMFFVSDDFYFLGIVAPADNALVAFEPLVGRFVRPLVVAMYYLNYHLFGLAPLTYHLSVLAAHWLTACLVYLITVKIAGTGEALWAFCAGLLFVVFAGHSEAVAWPAGAADPFVTAALMSAFFCYLRALEPESSRWWLAGFCASVLLATQAKEVWVVLPGVLLAHATVIGTPDRRRAAMCIGATIAAVVLFLVVRRVIFGSALGGVTVAFDAKWVIEMRAFLVRCFLPPGSFAADTWLMRRDLLAWPLMAAVIVFAARGRALRVIILSAIAMCVALVPAAALTISMASTESERFVYLPSVFSCILLVWTVRTGLKPRWLAAAVCAGMVCLHAAALIRTNRDWHAAGTLSRAVADSFADQVRRNDPLRRSDIYLLNAPDNMRGHYVFRAGFTEAIALLHPDVAARTEDTVCIATHPVNHTTDAVHVSRPADRGFFLDVNPNQFIQPSIPSSFIFKVSEQTPHSYRVDFTESLGKAIVLYVTEGRFQLAGIVEGTSAPFGAIVTPLDGTACAGASLRVTGWALDRTGGVRVRLEAEANPPVRLGWARRESPMPADLAPWYRAFPDTNHAGWEFDVPCADLDRASGVPRKIRVVAQTASGFERVIGERIVK
jgi:hypothetical protein